VDLAGKSVTTQAQVIEWLARQPVAAYLVGGCVRDRLLGRAVYDLDVVTAGDGLELARRLADHHEGAYHALDVERSTGRAILKDERGDRLLVDVARFRSEGPSGLQEEAATRHPDPLARRLALDLVGRDFTVNAMAADVRAPEDVIDPHGGQADLVAGLIRPVSDGSIRDDPLRTLRALRLAAELGFDLTSHTEALIRRDGQGLRSVSAERVRDELARLLILSNAAPYLTRLDSLGVLTAVFPELEPLRDLEQPPPHYLDALAHSLQTVASLEVILRELAVVDGRLGEGWSARLPYRHSLGGLSRFSDRLRAHVFSGLARDRPRLVALKLAALLHDAGKAAAQSIETDGRIRFLGHDRDSVRIAGQAFRRLRFTKLEVQLAETVVRHHMRPLLLAAQESVSSRAVYRFFRDTRDAGIDVLLHALADCRATDPQDEDGESWSRLVVLTARMLADYWERQSERVDPPSLIDGYALMREFGLQPGPQIGTLLETVREAQIAGEIHTYEQALDLVHAQLGSLHD
jgi:tRNA nucleotidyltransferase/poly(A) polymerase